MIHLRIVASTEKAQQAHAILERSASTSSLILLSGAATKPHGDLIMCDVAREDASVIISDLRKLGIGDDEGSIVLDDIESQISQAAVRAEKAARGLPSDAVVWEEIESRTSEEVELSATFVGFMALATMIAAVGVLTDQIVLIIGAMVVGPEFGPIAGLAVAVVQRRGMLARRSLIALAVGFPVAITAAALVTLGLDLAGLVSAGVIDGRTQTAFITNPDEFSVVVACLAGVAGILSLTSAKSGALVGVLISVTTIPAAGAIGVGIALGDDPVWVGALQQLSINLVAIFVTCVATLSLERLNYARRKRRHEREEPDPERASPASSGRAETPETGTKGVHG
ncbi:MAG: TIGR00341 family protein [Solirubrobacterales bacterium]|nr:TIGR00341 family protein [Solirubrobacterales bacterium]